MAHIYFRDILSNLLSWEYLKTYMYLTMENGVIVNLYHSFTAWVYLIVFTASVMNAKIFKHHWILSVPRILMRIFEDMLAEDYQYGNCFTKYWTKQIFDILFQKVRHPLLTSRETAFKKPASASPWLFKLPFS